jgi:hypothetical protein
MKIQSDLPNVSPALVKMRSVASSNPDGDCDFGREADYLRVATRFAGGGSP